MPTYLGLSFLRQSVHATVLDFNGGKVETRTDVFDAPKLPLFADLESPSMLSKFRNVNVDAACQILFKSVKDRKLGEISDALAQDRAFDSTCLVHPYTISPSSRRSLIAALDGTQPHVARSQSSRQGGGPAPGIVSKNRGLCCAIDAPFAAILFLDGQQRLNRPCSVITITQGVLGPEFLLIDCVQRGEFHVRIAAANQSAEQFACEAKDHISGKLLVATDPAFSELANLHFGQREIVGVSEDDIAIGAARYAAFSSGKLLQEPEGLQFFAVSPYAIGVIGKGEDSHYWCPVFERGSSLDGSPRSLAVNPESVPNQLLLAYSTGVNRVAGTWLPESEFDSCRYFTHVPVTRRDDADTNAIVISIQSSAGCTGFKWSDQLVLASAS